MAIGTQKIESYVPVVRYNEGLYTALPIQTTGALTVGGNLNVTGDIVVDDITIDALTVTGSTILGDALTDTLTVTGATAITSSSASAFAVGLNGATTPAFSVNSATGSQAAGLKVTGATTTGTVAVDLVGGAAVNLTIDAKGAGTIGIGTVSSGAVTIAPATTITGALTNTGATYSNGGVDRSSAAALAIGATNATSVVITPATTITGLATLTGGFTSIANGILKSGTAVPATAGAVAAGVPISYYSTGLSIEVTSDAPTHVRAKGSICINTAGSSSSTRLFINSDGSTGWIAITTAT